MKKKIISLFLSIVMVLTMVPTYSFIALADEPADATVSTGIENVDGDDENDGEPEEPPVDPADPGCDHVFTAENIPAEDNPFWETHSDDEYFVGSKAFISAELPASCEKNEEFEGEGWSIAKTDSTGFCMICGQVITEDDKVVIPAKGHNFVTVDEPTCTEDGSEECQNVNAKLTAVLNEVTGLYEATVKFIDCNETQPIDALGHDLEATEVVAPDCTNGGYTVYECTRCDYTENGDEVDALGHDWKEVASEVPATCTADGRTAEYKCNRCDAEKGGELVEAKGHTYNVTVSHDAKTGKDTCTAEDFFAAYDPENPDEYVRLDQEPTCTVEGKGIVKCTVCGHEVIVTIAALGHDDEDAKIILPAGCEVDGVKEVVCKRCNRTSRVIIDAHNHSWETEVVVPNCATGEAGYTIYTCNCGYDDCDCTASYKSDYVPATHTIVTKDVEIIKEATCEDEGLKMVQDVCSVCDYVVKTRYEVIPPLDHLWEDTVIPPTCTEAGYTQRVCQRDPSHQSKINYVDPTGHNYVTTTKNPTCTEDGSVTDVCDNVWVDPYTGEETVCGDTKVKVINKLGHIEGEPVLDQESIKGCTIKYDNEGNIVATATSCTENGSYDLVTYCIRELVDDEGNTYVCSTELNRETVVVKATGHVYEMNIKETVYPTCERPGMSYYTCIKCGQNTVGEPLDEPNHLVPDNYEGLANCQHGNQYVCQRVTYKEDEHNHRLLDDEGNFIVDGICGKAIDEGEKNTALTFKDEYKNVVVLPDDAKQVHLPTIAIPQCNGEDAKVYLARGEFDPEELVDYSVVDGKLATGHAEATLADEDGNYDVEGFYEITYYEATCEFDAYYVYTCKCCNGSEENGVFVVELINTAIGHRWALRDDLTNRDPSCTTDGTRYWFCLNDNGHQYTEKVPATGHNYTFVKSIAPTCTEGGYNLFVCENTAEDNDPDSNRGDKCGSEFKEYVTAPTGHQFVEDVTQFVAPSCNTEGKRVFVCVNGDCEETYVVVIPKTDNHTYTLVATTPATCTTEGTATYKCQDADCDAQYTINTTPRTGHQYVENKNLFVAPTCVKEGMRYYECVNCNDGVDCDANYTVVLPTTAHTPVSANNAVAPTCTTAGHQSDVICSVCGVVLETGAKINPTGHNYGKVDVVNPTCTSKGYTIHYCTNADCNAAYIDNYEAVIDHVLQVKTTIPATCGEDGVVVYVCNNCQYKNSEIIPATGNHQYSETVTVQPSCTTKGELAYECAACSYYYTKEIPVLGHSPVLAGNAVTPTCVEPGKTSDTICSSCGKTLAQGSIINPTGHNYGMIDVVNPTCTDKGYTIHTCTNYNCGASYKDNYTAVIDHVLEETITVPATCGVDGYVIEKCNNCTYSTKTILPATGNHQYSEEITVLPTCTEKGELTYTCSGCAYTYTQEIPATGHTAIVDGSTAVLPTCTTAGKEADIICSVCGVKLTDGAVIAPTGHAWIVSVVNPATCKSEGNTVYKCENCDATRIDDVTPIDDTTHNYVVAKQVEATCTSEGYNVYTCSICGNSYNKTTTHKTPHAYAISETKPATCTEAGSVTYKCAYCDDSYVQVIPATGHAWIVSVVNPATCKAEGNTVYKCENCEATRIDDITPIDPNNHVNIKKVLYTPATCVANGYWTEVCEEDKAHPEKSGCGYTFIIEDHYTATGHTWVETFTKATTAADGEKITSCAICGIKSTERIAQIAKVELSATKFTYTGKQIKPVVTVTDVDGNIIGSANYTVTYSNNKKIGKATVTVTFKGSKYEGTLTKTFTIIPKKAGISDIHAGKNAILFTWGRVGNCDGYQIQYSTSKSFSSKKSINVKSNKTVTKNITGLKSGKKYYIRIRTYKVVDGKKIYGEWNTTKTARVAK